MERQVGALGSIVRSLSPVSLHAPERDDSSTAGTLVGVSSVASHLA